MAVVAPAKESILHLYASMLRTSRSFDSYNFRKYFIDKTNDTFRQIQAESDPSKVRELYAQATKDLVIIRRSAIVNQLYGGWKVAVEIPPKAETFTERGDT